MQQVRDCADVCVSPVIRHCSEEQYVTFTITTIVIQHSVRRVCVYKYYCIQVDILNGFGNIAGGMKQNIDEELPVLEILSIPSFAGKGKTTTSAIHT